MDDENGTGTKAHAARSFDAVLERHVGALGRGQLLLLVLASTSHIAMAALLMLMVFTAQDPIIVAGAWRCEPDSPALPACARLLAAVSGTSVSSAAAATSAAGSSLNSNTTADVAAAAAAASAPLPQPAAEPDLSAPAAIHAAFCALPPGAAAWTAPANSLLSYYGLTCGREWHISLLDSLYFVGLAFGGTAFGAVSDRWGRRLCLYGCAALAAGASVCEAVVPAAAGLAGFWAHGAFRLVSAAAVQGLALADVVLVTELVGPDYRGRVGILTQSFFIAGECLLALLAAYVHDWRLLTLLCAVLPAAFLATRLTMPESPRWLAAAGRRHEAAVTMAALAALNGRGGRGDSSVAAIEAALGGAVDSDSRPGPQADEECGKGRLGGESNASKMEVEVVSRGRRAHVETVEAAAACRAACGGGGFQCGFERGGAEATAPAGPCVEEAETAALLMHTHQQWPPAVGGGGDAAVAVSAPRCGGGGGIYDSTDRLAAGGGISSSGGAGGHGRISGGGKSAGGGYSSSSEGAATATPACRRTAFKLELPPHDTQPPRQSHPHHGPPPTLLQAARHPLVLLYFTLLSFALCALVLSYYGIGFALSYIPGSLYVSFFLISIAEAPSALMTGLLIDRVGRCALVLGGMLVSGVGCIGCGLAGGSQAAQVLLAMLGKFGASGAWDVLVVYCAEVFPTSVRSVASGAIYQGARVGGVAAPFVFLLGSATGAPQAPFWLMGSVTLAAACLCVWLPETAGCDQPESLQQMEANAGRTTLALVRRWWAERRRVGKERREQEEAAGQGGRVLEEEVRVEVPCLDSGKGAAAMAGTHVEQRPLLPAAPAHGQGSSSAQWRDSDAGL